MEKTIAPVNYSFEQHYTGYYPELGTTKVGNGIAVTDRAITWQGEFGEMQGFPNGGSDFYNPNGINEYKISSFMTRYEPVDDQIANAS